MDIIDRLDSTALALTLGSNGGPPVSDQEVVFLLLDAAIAIASLRIENIRLDKLAAALSTQVAKLMREKVK